MVRTGQFLLSLLLIVFSATAPGRAQGIPKAVVAVLDYQLLMRESAAAQDIRRQIQAYRQSYQSGISAEEDALRQEEQALKQQRTILTPEAFDAKRQAFERKVIDVQRSVQDRTRQLDRAFNTAMGEVQKAVVPIVTELTEEMGFNVVVDKSQVLFAKKALDITTQVMAELDKRVPSVEVPNPGQ